MVAGIMVVVHVLFVFMLLAGVVGLGVTRARAGRATDVGEIRTLVGLAHIFETRLIRPAMAAVLVFGLLAAWTRGWPILGALQGAHTNWVFASLLIYLSIIPIIVFVFVPRGRALQAALDDAVAQNRMTPELRARFNDPAIAAARVYEIGVIVALTVLMVMRPF